ncbi:MAG: HDIG domain-containing protein [Paludibacteraceae bacterium]|nr:HDIG domain-containing protein [Paludibacteraceae bacterium]
MRLTTVTQNIVKALAFLVLGAATVYLYPRYDSSFPYRYEVGKPWVYDRVVAEHDFPIYKSEAQLAKEQGEVLQDFTPYYKYIAEQPKSPLVVTSQDREQLVKDEVTHVAIVENKVSTTHPLSDIYTPKSAYVAFGRNYNPNLVLDTLTTTQMRELLLQGISLTRGVVQAGEKVVDRGDIVTEETAVLLQSLKIAYENEHTTRQQTAFSILGEIGLVCLFIVLFVLYLFVFRPEFLRELPTMLFFCILSGIITVLACVAMRYTSLSIYLIPFAWVPIITRVFYDSRTALFLHIITVLLVAPAVPDSFEFIMVQIAIGMVAVAGLKDMTKRAQLARTAGWILLTYILIYTAFVLGTTGDWHNIDVWTYLYFGINTILIICAYGLIYLFERLFHFVSSITLVELTDINSTLLLEFAEKAPGSFQHSMQVSTLAMEAAKKIGAKSLLVRTGALYHDIGKLVHPEFFTENQAEGVNPLLDMSPEDAAQTVIAHVNDGIKLARQHHLPEILIHFIASHHGTSLTRYFYNTAVNNSTPEHPVESWKFAYPGPKPTTKETAILMMADAVEARSRSLKTYTEESIAKMVDEMIEQQIAEGQFAETPLSFKDVEDIKVVFKERLLSINHHRIKYPKITK